jgi:hypothetical protein
MSINRIKKIAVLFFVATIVFKAALSYADLQQNTSLGISWLIQSKLGNEYWGRTIPADEEIDELTIDDISQVAFRDSCDAAIAISTNTDYSVDYENVANWLSSTYIRSTEHISRRIIVLGTAGKDVSNDVSALLSYKNSGAGFGGYINVPSNPLDTALALSALKAANYSDTGVLYDAVSYLTSNQNSDGGWGLVSGDGSSAYVTSIVLRALSSYNSLFLLQDYVNKASSYLLTKQNSDGGFATSTSPGQGSSNVYETALAAISLIESGQGSTGTIQNAVSYLISTQSSNGSWNDDPYYTALALQALAAARPNLTITSIAESDSMPREGVDTTITATVTNAGFDNASNITVRFYLGDPSAGGTQIGTDQVISVLTPGSSAQVSINQSFTGTGGKTFTAII